MTKVINDIVNKDFTSAKTAINEKLEAIAERKMLEMKKMVQAKMTEQEHDFIIKQQANDRRERLKRGITEETQIDEKSPAWQRSAGKDPEGGLNRKGIASYRREHPGSKLSMAVTTKPSKLNPEGKAAKRRKSFCARMSGVDGPMKDEKGRPTRKAASLRRWKCGTK